MFYYEFRIQKDSYQAGTYRIKRSLVVKETNSANFAPLRGGSKDNKGTINRNRSNKE